jgi:hypothetical protein
MPINRRDLMRGAAALSLSSGLFACEDVTGNAPVKVVFDRDLCDHCAMLVSNPKFAAQAFDPVTRKVRKFDDVGCMIAHATEKGFIDRPETKLWVMAYGDGRTWLDAKLASYDDGVHSPMGYDVAARAPGEGKFAFAAVKDAAQKRANCDTAPHS